MSAPPADVTDRLERLAAHAPGGGVEPDAIWRSGRRRQRLRAGVVLAALVVVGLLGSTVTPLLVDRAQRVEPADPADRMVLPDVIRQPGEWEPAFRGAPGRLVAAGVGTRGGWWSSRPALWGVSAATGESRFLDLSDVASGGASAALSADGRRLAYWFTDEDVEALPGTREPGSSIPVPPAGVAVVDLGTGDIERWDAEAPHGSWTMVSLGPATCCGGVPGRLSRPERTALGHASGTALGTWGPTSAGCSRRARQDGTSRCTVQGPPRTDSS